MTAFDAESLALGLVFLIPGLAILALEAPNVWHGLASRRWHSTTGRVLERGIEPGSHRQRDSGLEIRYAYVVAGREHVGRRYDYGGRAAGSTKRLVAALLAHDPGQEITVYYDPRKPSRSVLRRGATWGTYARLGVGVVLSGLAGSVVIGALATLVVQ